MEKPLRFGLSKKCSPGQVQVRETLQVMNNKCKSNPVVRLIEDGEAQVQQDIAMELRTIGAPNGESNLISGDHTYQLQPERPFGTIPEEDENVMIENFDVNVDKTYAHFDNGSLFDSETDQEAEEMSHEIVYSAMTQLVQPQDLNINNLRNKLESEDENLSPTLNKLNKFFKIVSHLSFSCIFIYLLYILFFPF